MADNLTTTTEVDPGVELWYDRMLLINATPYLVHDRFAQRRPLPANNSKIIKFRRYTKLATATAQLSEGVTPPGKKLGLTDLKATAAQYGDFVHITDVVELTNSSGELNEAADILGMQMGETHDEIIRDILMTATGRTAFTAHLTQAELDTVVLGLLGNNARMITQLIHADDGVGTNPVRPAFWAIAHTAHIDDLQAVTGFKSTSEYPSQDTVDEAEWGSTDNIRWLVTTQARRSGSKTDPYDTTTGGGTTYNWIPVFGQNAYGITELSGGNAKTIIKALGSAGTADPLDQRSTMGWKSFFTGRVLNDNFMHIAIVDHS